MKNKTIFLFFLTILVVFSSCQRDEPVAEPPLFETPGVFVVNEGNFTTGNASLTWLGFKDSTLVPDAFYSVNKVPMGDVANFMTVHNGRGYIVVNNSGLVYVIDIKTGEFLGKITGLTSPRELIVINDNSAWISDLFSKSLYVVDLSTLQVVKNISLNGRTSESMVKIGQRVFVANWSKLNQQAANNVIMVVDAISEKVIDSIEVSIEPNSMVVDKNHKLWVMCGGGYANEVYPALYRINTEYLSVEKEFIFPEKTNSPFEMKINKEGNVLYFLDTDVYKMSISDNVLPSKPFVESGDNNFYALGICPGKEELFVSDALDYVRNGTIYIYSSTGVLNSSFEAGIIPGYFAFLQ